MAKEKYIELLEGGSRVWNEWIKKQYPKSGRMMPGDYLQSAISKIEDPDLSGIDLQGKDLSNYNFYYTNFSKSNLSNAIIRNSNFHKAKLKGTNLKNADLTESKLYNADLSKSNCSSAKFTDAWLRGARFINADLDKAIFNSSDLTKANLSGASMYRTKFKGATLENVRMLSSRLVETNFEKAKLNSCAVYGISAWNLNLENAEQNGFVVTPKKQSKITVDNLELAQFVYLLIHSSKLRGIIDTITSKVVLILGNFAEERKEVLNAIRNELRDRDYLPILFDFKGPKSRDLTETISTLAHLARFVVADITDARSIPQELQRIIPDLPSVPIKPIIKSGKKEYGMFEHLKRYEWVLETYEYLNNEKVISNIEKKIINPSEAAARRLLGN